MDAKQTKEATALAAEPVESMQMPTVHVSSANGGVSQDVLEIAKLVQSDSFNNNAHETGRASSTSGSSSGENSDESSDEENVSDPEDFSSDETHKPLQHNSKSVSLQHLPDNAKEQADQASRGAGESMNEEESESSDSSDSSESEEVGENDGALDVSSDEEIGGENHASSCATAITTKNETTELPPASPVMESIGEPRIVAGAMESVLDGDLIIQAKTDTNPVEEGTVLGLQDGTPVAKVWEIFGPVTHPRYVLRLPKQSQHLKDEITQGTELYYCHTSSTHVFPERLHFKGSDASNQHDEEVPLDEQDFSDDETEAAAKAQLKAKKRAKTEQGAMGPLNKLQRGQQPAGAGMQPLRLQPQIFSGHHMQGPNHLPGFAYNGGRIMGQPSTFGAGALQQGPVDSFSNTAPQPFNNFAYATQPGFFPQAQGFSHLAQRSQWPPPSFTGPRPGFAPKK